MAQAAPGGSFDSSTSHAPSMAAPAPPPPAPAPVPQEDPRSVQAFDDQIIRGRLKAFIDASRALEFTPLTEQAGRLESLYLGLRGLILTAALCKKPDTDTLKKLIKPLEEDMLAINKIKDSSKDRDWANHLTVIADGSGAVGWVMAVRCDATLCAAAERSRTDQRRLSTTRRTQSSSTRTASSARSRTRTSGTSSGLARTRRSSTRCASTSRTTTMSACSGTRR